MREEAKMDRNLVSLCEKTPDQFQTICRGILFLSQEHG